MRIGVIGGAIMRGVYRGERDNRLCLEVAESGVSEPPPSAPLTVVIGHPRPIVLKRVIRDLASLAIESIVVFRADLSEASYLRSSLWDTPRQFLIDGAMQGGTTRLPCLDRCASLEEAMSGLTRGAKCLRLELERYAGPTRSYRLASLPSDLQRAALFVGPERGFSDRERGLLADVDVVTLGPVVLRTEAAVIAGATALADRIRST